MHRFTRKDWTQEVWEFPMIHRFEFGFGLSAEAPTKQATIQPYIMQDNAMIDYETKKTNPENADFVIETGPNCRAGSYIPNVKISYTMYIPPSDTEIVHMAVDQMRINTAMLNRLDATDKISTNDIETILELTHEVTDEQAYPLWNGTKLFEGAGTFDLPADVPGLSTNQQPEGIAFVEDTFFKAKHYYTNKQMLNLVTQNFHTSTLSEPLVPHGRSLITYNRVVPVPDICKTMNPYSFFGEMWNVPQVGTRRQYHLAGETTAIEHLTVKGAISFNEFNPAFNFARA